MNICSMFLYLVPLMSFPIQKVLWMQTLSFCRMKELLLCFQFIGGAWLIGWDPNICMQVDPWFSVNATHNIRYVVHQKVHKQPSNVIEHKQHSNVIESFIHIGNYSTLCFINSLSFLLWIQVEYFCWKKGMCQCTTQGYFHPLGLIQKKIPQS
jgi:hypothetical protein